jgi:hypothetical protein
VYGFWLIKVITAFAIPVKPEMHNRAYHSVPAFILNLLKTNSPDAK